MTSPSQDQPESTPSSGYLLSYEGAITTQLVAARVADRQASFFMPALRSGMSLLDCGCGPGSITLGLAKAVAPGEVVGVDIGESQIEKARSSAVDQGITNARFEVADIYDLPFPENSFDAVFGHAVLGHLSEPSKAMSEMYRVVKPGGIAGIRNPDWGSQVMFPSNDILEAFWDIRTKIQLHTGRDAGLGRKTRQILREAGFTHTVGSASTESWGTIDGTRQIANTRASYLEDVSEIAIQLGWTDEDINKTKIALNEWSEHSDAIYTLTYFEAIGFKE